MVVDKGYIDWVMELLSPVGAVTSRAMFGGHGIFENGVMFALVSKESSLYFKTDESNISFFNEAESKHFKPMPYHEVPADILEDADELSAWAKRSIAIAKKASKK